MMNIHFFHNDLPDGLDFGSSVAIDTETMGLAHHRDRLCLVQLCNAQGDIFLVQMPPASSELGPQPILQAPHLCRLLTNNKILKIFHYGRFDIAALAQNLGVLAQPVYCTKIASRLARTFTSQHSLKDLCQDLLNITLDKTEQTSDWGAETLSESQRHYASLDVQHLHALKAKLDEILQREGRKALADACFHFLPYRALLDLQAGETFDIFAHR